jgi:hypothetical protein
LFLTYKTPGRNVGRFFLGAMKGDEKAMKGVDGWFRDVVETQNFASLHPGENVIYS